MRLGRLTGTVVFGENARAIGFKDPNTIKSFEIHGPDCPGASTPGQVSRGVELAVDWVLMEPKNKKITTDVDVGSPAIPLHDPSAETYDTRSMENSVQLRE
jgi:hypothetical protein